MYWREEEKNTIAVLYRFSDKNESVQLHLLFSEGEEYICSFESAYESDNQDDIDNGNAVIQEDFFSLSYHVDAVIKSGCHGYQVGDYFDIDYRDFPIKVTTKEGHVIFPTTHSVECF